MNNTGGFDFVVLMKLRAQTGGTIIEIFSRLCGKIGKGIK